MIVTQPGWLDSYTAYLRPYLISCRCPTCADREIETEDWPDPHDNTTKAKTLQALEAGTGWPWCSNTIERCQERHRDNPPSHERAPALIDRLSPAELDHYLTVGDAGDWIWESPDV